MRNPSKPTDEIRPNETQDAPSPQDRLDGLEERGWRYKKRGPLGRGAMGEVDAVWDPSLRRTLAMKRLREDVIDPNAMARFLEEAQITGQLEHPGIVPLHELARDADGRPFFTMRRIRGRSLKDLLKRVEDPSDSEWTREGILTSLLRVCETMAYAHTKGVVHRDIKPSNIMVGRFGETYVVDWGLGRLMDQPDSRDLRIAPETEAERTASLRTDGRDEREDSDAPIYTMDGDVVGTPAYMSPEQAYGDLKQIGPHSDVYSIGATLYHLLAGHAPYVEPGRRMSGRIVLARLLEGPPKALCARERGVPPELVSICEKAMSRRAQDRYSDCRDLADDLRAFLEGRVVQAHRSGPWIELRKWAQRNRKAGWAIALMALAILSAVGWAWRTQKLRAQDADTAVANITTEQARAEELGDLMSSSYLNKSASALGYGPAQLTATQSWVQRAQSLLTRHRLRMAGANPAPLTLNEQEWKQLAANVRGLELIVGDCETRLTRAEEAHRAVRDDYADDWGELLAELGNDPRFADSDLSMRSDLVPLGKNSKTNLYEFWLPISGERPEESGEPGEWRITEDTGMVFILLPGGTFSMGTARENPPENYTERLHSATVGALYVSKYEVTQGQWLRTRGMNPSYARPGRRRLGLEYDLTHPVETVPWIAATEFATTLGARLPTEQEREFFARAGTTTTFPWGENPEVAEGLENFGDATAFKNVGAAGRAGLIYNKWSDGYPEHAPVGSFAPNPFGLYDVLGNVSEWTLSNYQRDYGLDGTTFPESESGIRRKVVRGGDWWLPSHYARPAYRRSMYPGNAEKTVGLRLVLEPS